jgi:drug/metabolite transporter (DMT)-like permease
MVPAPSPTERPVLILDRMTIFLVAWSVAMSVSAQLTLRTGMADYSLLTGTDLALAAISSPMVWAGLGLYILGTVSWLAVLSRIDLAVAYPLGSMNYVLVTLLAASLLDENVTLLRWVGTASILVGILVVARGEPRASRPRNSR